MRRKNEKVTRNNEEEILVLKRENEEMERKFVEGGPSVVPTNLVGRSFTSPPNLKTAEETKVNVLIQEMDGESHPNKSVRTTGTLDLVHRHPSTDSISGVPLPDKWKGFNKDHFVSITDLDEHMDVYTTHMSLYNSDDVVLCRVFPTSLKAGALSWFTKLPPTSSTTL